MRIGLLHSRELQGDSGAECFGHPYHDRRGSERPGKYKQQTGECRHQGYWNHALQPSSEFGTESVPVLWIKRERIGRERKVQAPSYYA